jgi:autotransporter-associated beta strand protein
MMGAILPALPCISRAVPANPFVGWGLDNAEYDVSYPPFVWDYIGGNETNFTELTASGDYFQYPANPYPNFPGSHIIFRDLIANAGTNDTQPIFANRSGVLPITTGTPIRLGTLDLDVDNSALEYDIVSTKGAYYEFDNTINNQNASITTGAFNNAIDPGLDRFEAPMHLATDLDIHGTFFRITGKIQSAGAINSYLSGVLFLDDDQTMTPGHNTFTGGVIIHSGAVQIDADSELGKSTGALQFDAVKGSSATLASRGTAISGTRPIVLTTAGTILTLAGSTFKETGPISGKGALTLSDGIFTLGTSNIYTGGTILGNGSTSTGTTLMMHSDAGSSTGTLGATSGALVFDATSGKAPNLDATASFSIKRGITLTSNGVFEVSNSDTLTLAGKVTGSGALFMDGPGALSLTDAANTYVGGTVVDGGTLLVSKSSTLGTGGVSLNGGTLVGTADASLGNEIVGNLSLPISVNAGATLSLTGKLASTVLTKGGAGTLSLSAASDGVNLFTIAGGTLGMSTDGPLGGASNRVTLAGGTFEATGGFTAPQSFIGGTKSVDLNYPVNIQVDSGHSLTISGVVSGQTSSLVDLGTGALTLSNPGNTYGGGTVINGAVHVSADGDLGAPTGAITFGGTLQRFPLPGIAGTLVTTRSFSTARPITLGTYGGQLAPASGTKLSVTGNISGTSGLFVDGAGTVSLSTNNTYSGGTVITSGTLVTTSAGTNVTALGSGPVTLSGGKLQLGEANNQPGPLPLSFTGFNQDVVVERTATSYQSAVTQAFDAANNFTGYAFYEQGYAGQTTTGLPQNHTFTSPINSAEKFTLAPYTSKNALIVPAGTSGTLQLTTPGLMNNISFLATAANGPASIDAVLSFTDGSSAVIPETVNDWFGLGVSDLIISGRVSLVDGSIQNAFNYPRVYEYDLTLPAADTVKFLKSVKFEDISGGSLGVLALSGAATTPQTYSNAVKVIQNSALEISGSPLASVAGLSVASSKLTITAAGKRSVLTLTNGITLSGSTAAIDIGKTDLDIVGAGLDTVTALAGQGYNGGAWTGNGITSSIAAGDTRHLTAIGVIQNNQLGAAVYNSGNPFDGATVGGSDILVKYTYYGDTDLNGTVDATDIARENNGMNNHLTGWYNGDFNYDGVINGSDTTLIDNAFAAHGAALGDAEIAQTTAELAGYAPTAAVPEPTSAIMAAIGGITLALRRRRR